MKTLARFATCLALLTLAADGLAAQSRAFGAAVEAPPTVGATPAAPLPDLFEEGEWGLGAVIDFIHKMSGPRFLSGGATLFYESLDSTGIRLRLTGTYGASMDEAEEVDPDDSHITILTLQPTVEFPVRALPLEFAIGYALHRFGGDAEAFWHHSFPVQAQLRSRSRSGLVPRIGLGLRVFPAFQSTDFGPLVVTVSRDDTEAVFQLFAGVDYYFR